jgi:tRNA (cmo5U34)-methyltransferase
MTPNLRAPQVVMQGMTYFDRREDAVNPNQPSQKSSVEEIRARFDREVERFSNLETGQSATIDAPLVLELIAASAASATPQARSLLDVGCGAGNYTLKLLERLPLERVTLIDLSGVMLDRARQRIAERSPVAVETLQVDIRQAELPSESFDVITAAAVLHHLRSDQEWHSVFAKLHACLRPGGSLWISDLVDHVPQVQELMWERYGSYLEELKGAEYRKHVLAYVEHEDTPRPLVFQLELLKSVGFRAIEVLHKNGMFAAFGAIR